MDDEGPGLGAELWTTLFSPLVAVVTSPDANEVFRNNNLASFDEFLAPFCTIDVPGRVNCGLARSIAAPNLVPSPLPYSVTVHDAQGAPSTLESFHIRFRDPSRLRLIENDAIAQLAVDALERAPKPGSLASPFPKEEQPELAQLNGAEPTTEHVSRTNFSGAPRLASGTASASWFDRFAHDFALEAGTSEHETFNHPVACGQFAACRLFFFFAERGGLWSVIQVSWWCRRWTGILFRPWSSSSTPAQRHFLATKRAIWILIFFDTTSFCRIDITQPMNSG